ncbi:MAG: hypothetical protein ACR2HQ_15515 [Ilumatobacteraceae bacterium]
MFVRALGVTAALAAALVPSCEPACGPPPPPPSEPRPTDEVVALVVAGIDSRWTRVIDADLVEVRFGLESLREAFNEGDRVLLTDTSRTTEVSAATLDAAYALPSSTFVVEGVTRDRSMDFPFAFIGDSLGVSMTQSDTDELPALLDGVFAAARYDAVGARCTADPGCVSTGLAAAQAVPVGTELVVVELGINDLSGFATKLDRVMQVLVAKGVDTVIWPTVSTRSTYASGATANNAALFAAAAGRWSGRLQVPDWNAHSSGAAKDAWFTSDRIHLTATGQAEMALFIRNSVIDVLPPPSAEPPTTEPG